MLHIIFLTYLPNVCKLACLIDQKRRYNQRSISTEAYVTSKPHSLLITFVSNSARRVLAAFLSTRSVAPINDFVRIQLSQLLDKKTAKQCIRNKSHGKSKSRKPEGGAVVYLIFTEYLENTFEVYISKTASIKNKHPKKVFCRLTV